MTSYGIELAGSRDTAAMDRINAFRGSDYLLSLAALQMQAIDLWAGEKTRVRSDLSKFIDFVEERLPQDVCVQSACNIARSLVVLDRPICALLRIELLLAQFGHVPDSRLTTGVCQH
ncbi:hypothetical protein E1N52_18010 [Paraburkholderia guartelaensis]|uniref:Uncharacterized protein n=1 Tax=Paraburkholderia guartelaensis TaxID=2546446 RepID=A0A4R5LFM4_9BURK|nr:hypothetical protein [Paraburkholderia guartelaensis]TDG07139.1 hypothetical protein E1N52_18010 [Paraburkholderia guartelaensis]